MEKQGIYNRVNVLVQKLRKEQTEREALSREIEADKAELIALMDMGEQTTLFGDDYKITLVSTKRRRLDIDRLVTEHPDIAAGYRVDEPRRYVVIR